MAARWTLVVVFCTVCTTISLAQTKENFDIISFISPSTWKKETADYVVSYVTTNNLSGGWCRISIYQSRKSSGDVRNDFKSEWNDLVTKNYPDANEVSPTQTLKDGWTYLTGTGKFPWQNQESIVTLTTITGYDQEVSLLVMMNNQEFKKKADEVINSVELKKPAPTTEPQKPILSPASSALTEIPGSNGISVARTNFDDGWTAEPYSDYVKVYKVDIKVLLHYPIKIDDEMRNTNELEAALFDRLILPRYQVSNIRKFDNGGPCYFCVYFFEANAIEKATGKNLYIGFRVITTSGISRCIEIVASSELALKTEFPNQEKVAAMLDYNKFAISLNDLVGSWEESSGAYVDMYNTVTGSYAGMNTSSSSNSFVFNEDGTYSSHHNGAFGMIGNMKFYDQKYNGKMILTNWDLTLTNRFENKTDIYWAQFEAVRGGRVLHLTDKGASGIQYHLVLTK